MKKIRSVTFLPLLLFTILTAQVDISYYLPDTEYDDRIPSPEQFLGYQVGEWHIPHALVVSYLEHISGISGKAFIYEYARSYEARPLVHMVISSENNIARIEEIRENHLRLTDPELSGEVDISKMPAVIMLGYGIHGNEQSSHNAAPLVAYYLTAGRGDMIEKILENTVIIIDPSLNPDGQDRFASWVNRYRSRTLNPDPNNHEFHEVWPGSRTNHYWFDLNRDWLAVQHPESYGRVRAYHRWKPNIFNDHHEMGTNTTFFFQPGPPERVNPLIPAQTEKLALQLAHYHAAALDRIGQLYFTQETFDDFNFGMGYTYPDLQGSLAILFEQASARGHKVETIHGIMDFPMTIRNQVAVSLSTMEAGLDMRETLHDHLRWFHTSAIEEAGQDPAQAYVFGDSRDNGKNYHFLDILLTHGVEVYELRENIRTGDLSFSPPNAWIVPLQQPQYRLIRTIFETVLEFDDSLFYDVTSWTKPLSFNIPFGEIGINWLSDGLKGDKVESISHPRGMVKGGKAATAYLFQWDDYYSPKALYFLQNKGLRTKVATMPFSIETAEGEVVDFSYGTIMVHTGSQDGDPEKLYGLIQDAARKSGITFYSVETSFSQQGIHLGSGSFSALQKPEILMLIEQGTNSREAGEIWHLLDQRYHIPVTKTAVDRVNSMDLTRYNTIIMVSGNYNSINEPGKDALEQWVRKGGTIVAMGSANLWLSLNGFVRIEFTEVPETDEPVMLPYHLRSRYLGARRISGSIFRANLDITHPIGYGYRNGTIAVHVAGTLKAKPGSNPFGNPLVFDENSLISGYAWKPYREIVDGSAGILISSKGSGRIVSFVENPNFRAYWFGTNKLFANSIFFGRITVL